jgi:hypothetical protein
MGIPKIHNYHYKYLKTQKESNFLLPVKSHLFPPGFFDHAQHKMLGVREKGRWMSCSLPHKLARGQGRSLTKDAQVGLRVNLI